MGKVLGILFLGCIVATMAIAVSPRWNMPLVARTLYARALEAREYAVEAKEYASDALAERSAEARRRERREAKESRRVAAHVTPPAEVEPTPIRAAVPTYDEIPEYTSRAVRPGSSTALRARRIDATVYPPLVRAKEAVADLPSRIPVPTPSFMIGVLGLSAIVLAFAVGGVAPQRQAVGLAPLLLLALTSFHPMPERPAKRTAAPRDVVHSVRPYQRARPSYEQIAQAPPDMSIQIDVPSDDQVIVVPMAAEPMRMDDMQRRMDERMRAWDERRQMIAQQRADRARARQQLLDRRLREQICQIVREQGLGGEC